MKRIPINDLHINAACALIPPALVSRIKKHGQGAFASSHEALGVITEEYIELIEAIRSNKEQLIASELMDVIIGCLFELISMKARGRERK